MPEKYRVITTKTDVPADTISKKGFHLLNMGKEGMWLVDQEHLGYPGCVRKAIEIASKEGDLERVKKYEKLPGWGKVWINPNTQINKDIEEKEAK